MVATLVRCVNENKAVVVSTIVCEVWYASIF